ncbi:MAG: FRG domain-containing protein [Neisseriaceae bacterium]|nr:MAG: FRG domain-containing protein [Neisseriaceae bacterium]
MDKVLEILSQINRHIAKIQELYGKTKIKGDFSIVFRGHSDKSFMLLPTLFRKDENGKFIYQVGKEHVYINEYIKKFPEFSSQPKINVLADMQHYGLPTRLLDWTTNPLIALYFACSGKDTIDKDGSVLFGIKDFHLSPQENLDIAEFISDLASYDRQSFNANIALQDSNLDYRNLTDLVVLYVSNFDRISSKHGALRIPDSDPIKPLLEINENSFSILDKCQAYLRDEKEAPQFVEFLRVINSPYCFINAPAINQRVIAQQGLFQIFAGKHYDGYDNKSYKISLGLEYVIDESEQVIISSSDKADILYVLDKRFNINASTLYLKDKQELINEFK